MASSSMEIRDQIGPDDIIIPVMGITGSGKSTFIARCTGDTSGIGHGLASHTKDVAFGTLVHKGRKIRLIDTPGFDDSADERDDSYILKEIAAWLVIAYSQDPRLLLSGVIYLHPINEPGGRMKGSAKNNLKMFKAMCGEEPLSCVVLATTIWNKIHAEEGQKRQADLSKSYWSNMLEAGSKVLRHDDTRDSALQIIDHIMSQRTHVSLKIQRQLVDEGKSVEDTSAGQELRSKVINEREKTEVKLQETQEELEEAIKKQDSAAADDALYEQARYEALIRAKDAELDGMKIKAEELYKQKLEELAQANSDREKQRQETQEKMSTLRKELEAVQNHQEQLKSAPNPPPAYEVASLSYRNDMLQLELKRQERQMEMCRLKEQQRLQAYFHQESLQMGNQQLLVSGQQLSSSKKGVIFGAIGAFAGTAALGIACTVM